MGWKTRGFLGAVLLLTLSCAAQAQEIPGSVNTQITINNNSNGSIIPDRVTTATIDAPGTINIERGWLQVTDSLTNNSGYGLTIQNGGTLFFDESAQYSHGATGSIWSNGRIIVAGSADENRSVSQLFDNSEILGGSVTFYNKTLDSSPRYIAGNIIAGAGTSQTEFYVHDKLIFTGNIDITASSTHSHNELVVTGWQGSRTADHDTSVDAVFKGTVKAFDLTIEGVDPDEAAPNQNAFDVKALFEEQVTVENEININTRYDGQGVNSSVIFKEDVHAGAVINAWGEGSVVFEKNLTLDKGDETSRHESLIVANRGTTTFDGVVDTTAANTYTAYNGDVVNGGGIALTLVKKETEAKGNSNVTIFNNQVNAGTASIEVGYIDALNTILEGEGLGEHLDPTGKVKVILGSNGSTTGSLTAQNVHFYKNATLEVQANTYITGKTDFHEGSVVDVGRNQLTINGATLFASGSTYKATLGELENSNIHVDGKATISNGANLILLGVNPSEASDQSVFTSTLEIDGVFTNSLYKLDLSDDKKRLVIGDINSAEAVVENVVGAGGMSTNYVNAAGLVDQVMASGGALATTMSDTLQRAASKADGNPAMAKAVFSQLFGEHGLTGTAAIQATAQNFASSIGNHQIQLRDRNGAVAQAGSSSGYASLRGVRGDCSSFDPNRIWAGGFGAWTKQDDKNNVFGYKYNSGGFILGYDREVGDLTFGISAAYSNGEIKNNEGFTKTDVDTFNAGVYASYNHWSGLFIDANLGLGFSWNDTDTTDIIAGGRRDGKYRNNSFQAGATVGYEFTLPQEFRIIPSVGVQYTHVHQEGWNENIQSASQIGNWFDKTNNNYLSIPVAVRLNKTFRFANGASVTPEIRGAWIYEARDSQAHVRMGYVGSAASTSLYGIDSGKNRGLVGAGVKAKFNRRIDAFVDYNFEFRSGYKNHNVMAGIGVGF